MPSRTQEISSTLEIVNQEIATVVICVATYRRAEGLKRLLHGIEKLEFKTSPAPNVQVVVVDNDPRSGIGAEVCKMFLDSPLKLTLLEEEQPGISSARNRGVQEAILLGAEAIAFIDDDEIPDPRWLDALLEVQSITGAEAVAGPVIPHFEPSAPTWAIRGGFFNRPRHSTGSEVKTAPTCNLLLLADVFKDLGLRFDVQFGLSGGEDTLLTSQLLRQGARIVWADDAIVREWIPQHRTHVRYILQHAYANGSSWARVEHRLNPSVWTKLKRAISGLAKIAQGSTLLLPSALLGHDAVVQNASKASLGLGMLAGLLGHSFGLYGSSKPNKRETVKGAVPRVLIIHSQIKQYRVPFFDQLHEILLRDGIQLRVAYSDPSPSEAKKTDNQELPTEYGIKVRGHRILAGKIFYQPLLSEIFAADLVIVEQASKHLLNPLLLILSTLGVKKVAFWGHGKNRQQQKKTFAEWIKQRTLRSVDWWFAYTGGTARYLMENGVPASKITDVQNAVDTNEFRRGWADIAPGEVLAIRQQMGIPENSKVGLFCGGIFREKMPEFLIDSARKIRAQVPDFELVIVGAGPMQDVVQAAIGGEPWIRFVGPKFGREKLLFFKLADVFLMPGPVGLAILDAFSACLPIITTTVPFHGPEIEYLTEGQNGLMTDVDLDAYSDTVVRLLTNEAFLQDLKKAPWNQAIDTRWKVWSSDFIQGSFSA